MRSSGVRVPSIGEAEATGEIAGLRADIRQPLAMIVVSLIWRNLASIPGALRATAETMQPLTHWPGMLVLCQMVPQPRHGNSSPPAAVDAVLADGRQRGHAVSGALGTTGLPDAETATAIRDSLENRVPNAMARMIPVMSLLLRLMPAPDGRS